MYIIGKEEIEAVGRVIESQQLFRYSDGGNSETDKFERAWAEKIGTNYALAVTSGTAALIAGLVGLGIGPGDEVIVPAYTFMASASAVLAVGAVPIIVDIDETLTMDPAAFQDAITPNTKAVIPVHINGFPCDMDRIMDVAHHHNLLTLEDTCQADGGDYKGKKLGSIGDAGAFSFNQYKIITCGEGGALVTNSKEVYEQALIHHDSGAAFREYQEGMNAPLFAGWNFRINEILSAILRVQLERLDTILAGLRAEKQMLMAALDDETVFTFNPSHDSTGDCGTTLALLFNSEKEVRSFLARAHELGVAEAMTPIDSGRHVFENWTPILKQRGANHPRRNGYNLIEPPVVYPNALCTRSLDILARTLFIPTLPDRSPVDLEMLIEKLKEAAKAV